MTFSLRLLVVGLASFGAASLIGCTFVAWWALGDVGQDGGVPTGASAGDAPGPLFDPAFPDLLGYQKGVGARDW